MSKFLAILELFTHPKRVRSILPFNHNGYLFETGWFKSYDSKKPVDADGNPIPWVTYSFIDFIKTRLTRQHTIFEFGSGNSTFYYSKYAGVVVSVEHDKSWYEIILKNRPENAEIIFCELQRDGDYCRMPVKLEEKFDIIIVDGRDRVNCCIQCINALSPGGVIVLDDSEREFYQPGMDFLKGNGFKQLSFSGISPGSFYLKSTSVFYKADNCLGI